MIQFIGRAIGDGGESIGPLRGWLRDEPSGWGDLRRILPEAFAARGRVRTPTAEEAAEGAE